MSNAPAGFFPIESCPEWFVNHAGEVWSRKVGKMLKPHDNGRGYKQLLFRGSDGRKKHYIHRLVAETFIGVIGELTVNHIDGDTSNNNISNLEIISHKENNHHAIITGLRTRWRGASHPMAKLTEQDVLLIRQLDAKGSDRKEIAREFGISTGTVSDIRIGKSWAWLKTPKNAI